LRPAENAITVEAVTNEEFANHKEAKAMNENEAKKT
jgi:hypothetical protein